MKHSEVYSISELESDSQVSLNKLPKMNKYILANVYGTKTVKKYVANVAAVNNQKLRVKFMSRCPETKDKFVFSGESECSCKTL